MQITVIGATCMVGRRVVAEALARGHRVTAAARGTALLDEAEGPAQCRARFTVAH